MDETYLFSRGWLLLLLEAAERNAVYPIDMTQLHKLVYLGNVLAPIYNVPMPNDYTLKHMRGPYFHKAQWDIGRLVAGGLVDVQNVEAFRDKYGFWLKADYRISLQGIELVKKLILPSSIQKISLFLREVMRACSELDDNEINYITNNDIHYSHSTEGKGIDISMPDGNLSQAAVIRLFPEQRTVTKTESIHRYVSYLQIVSKGV